MGQYLPCFKAYDVRGKVPSELNPEVAYAIGRAYAEHIKPKRVCIGYDIRLSGPGLYEALAKGLNDAGVDVVHLGMIGTEMVYFATAYYGLDGGIMITASHNPPEYNGLKMVRSESRPISGDTGLLDIEKTTFEYLKSSPQPVENLGSIEDKNCYADFVTHLTKIVDPADIKPLKVLADPGNGAAGIALNELLPEIPLQVDQIRAEPDGTFPNGVPNPILEESRAMTVKAMSDAGEPYAFGVAWDGDYDRCFFFDEKGEFIEGYYIVGLLAQAILQRDPNHTIIYDPRLYWNTLDIVGKLNGRAVVCKSGHAFIKEKMRAEDAIYGGEMSAHHYFKDHWYCDSGMLPFLLIARLVSRTGRSLGDLVGEMIQNYPCSGEINSEVPDVKAVLAKVEAVHADGKIDKIDGLSVEYDQWRFNLRGSNTEPVIRLNVESRGDKALMEAKTVELLGLIRSN
ncbi:MAG: phosphomannomutase [Armatimonadetes bacterium 55-13]|nr:phosphomannomutase [Armatimonadota bacterium]OJU62661.1 MAG: phosphomannomutase [Armatimonadetes bacterium 55-13]